MNRGEKRESFQVKLPEAASVYDARHGALLGQLREFPVSLEAGEVSIIALYPYIIKDMKGKLESERIKSGQVIKGSFALGRSSEACPWERHMIYLETADPKGGICSWYSRSLLMVDGKVDFEIPTALNDMEGQWKITARDIVSGVKADLAINLTPGDKK